MFLNINSSKLMVQAMKVSNLHIKYLVFDNINKNVENINSLVREWNLFHIEDFNNVKYDGNTFEWLCDSSSFITNLIPFVESFGKFIKVISEIEFPNISSIRQIIEFANSIDPQEIFKESVSLFNFDSFNFSCNLDEVDKQVILKENLLIESIEMAILIILDNEKVKGSKFLHVNVDILYYLLHNMEVDFNSNSTIDVDFDKLYTLYKKILNDTNNIHKKISKLMFIQNITSLLAPDYPVIFIDDDNLVAKISDTTRAIPSFYLIIHRCFDFCME